MAEATETQQFLSALYEDSTGYLCVVTVGDESGQPDQQRWFDWPREQTMIEKYIDIRADEDVYTAVALYSAKERTGNDRDAKSRVVYADADTCHPSNFRLTPSISVQTSEGRWHCFWMLDGEVSAQEAAEASHRIAKAHQSQGCDQSGWIASKILRVPGTTNRKHGKAEQVEAKYTWEIYSLDKINKAYSDIDVTAVTVRDKEQPPMLDIVELENRLIGSPAADLYLAIPAASQSWSERLYRLELDLFRDGFTTQEVYTIAWHAKCNKYHPDAAGMLTQSGVPIPRRANPENVLWQEVLKAEGEYRIETRAVSVDPEPGLTDAFKFVTDEERKFIEENPTFIEEFSDWVGTRSPQSAVRYRRSAAYMLLSCVFGDKGYVSPQFGRVPLNMWVMTLGGTSSTKKTTVKDLMMEVLDHFSQMTGDHNIMLANDFSSEALNKNLGPRDGKVSMIVIDELHGFLREILGKGYKSGLKEVLTDLFNGLVRVALRMSKDSAQMKKARTVFNFYGIGTDKQVTKVLTLEDFQSGFMMRPVYAVADPVSVDKEDDRLRLRDEYVAVKDGRSADFARRFVRIGGKFNDVEIQFEPDAWERFDQWQDDTFEMVNMLPHFDLVKPGIDRLKVTVLKASALIAMSEERSLVSKADMLHVIAQAELWFTDLLRMINSVSESEFQQQANEIAVYIRSGKGHKRNRANTMRAFSRYRTRQFDEFIDSLVQQGRIKEVRDGKATYLESLESDNDE